MAAFNPFDREEKFVVRTKYGKKTVRAVPLLRSGGVIFLSKKCKLGRGDKGVRVPTGTPIVRHLDLACRTKGRVTHMVVKDGLYRLFAQAQHVAHGTEADFVRMTVTTEDLKDLTEFIRTGGQLSLDHHERIAELLDSIGDELDVPKRNEHKLTSAARSKKAARTRYRDGRVKPGPGHFVARAAAVHSAKRVRELQEMAPAVTHTMFKIYELLDRFHRILARIWRYFTSQETEAELPVPVLTAMERLTRNRDSVHGSCATLEAFEVRLHELYVQPFTELSGRLIRVFAGLRKAILHHRRDRVIEFVRESRMILRRLRMIRYIELRLLPMIPGGGGISSRDVLLKRHTKLMARLRDMKDHELDVKLREESIDYLELFSEDLENDEPEGAKRHLKVLGAILATA